MKSQNLQSETDTCNNLWDEFVSHLESIYFEGAADLLDTELISFEYHEYMSSIAN